MSVSVSAPTLTKQQVLAWVTVLANEGFAAVAIFDSSVHISDNTKGLVAAAAQLVAGAIVAFYNHSSHKVEIAKIAADANKVVSGAEKIVASLPPTIPAS